MAACADRGELVQNCYAVAGSPLANELALVSGQGPTAQTATDCPSFSRITPARKGQRGQVLGTGCVYPRGTHTLANQLTTAGHTWKAYVAGVGGDARTACRVPKLGSRQPQLAGRTSYLAWRNPFLYFRSLTAGPACRQSEVGIEELGKDVRSASTAPSLAYIIAAPCATGGEAPCKPGASTSLAGANRCLRSVVPEIKRSAASAAGSDGEGHFDFDDHHRGDHIDGDRDVAGCHRLDGHDGDDRNRHVHRDDHHGNDNRHHAGDLPGRRRDHSNRRRPGWPAADSPYVKPGSIDVVDYFNHFSLLATIENLFGMHRLGYAGLPGLPVFGLGVFNAYSG